MLIGLDIGYSHVKAVSDNRKAYFPSTVGNLEREHFSLDGVPDDRLVVNVDDDWVMVGEEAKLQSQLLSHRLDRDWIASTEYRQLYLSALTQLTSASGAALQIVTGLPVIYYEDHQELATRLIGDHRARREGRNWQTFRVEDVRVLPQPFGALLAEVLDNHGRIVNNELATGRVGVIDIGGKTTGFLTVDNLREIPKETTAIPNGCWVPMRMIRETVNDTYPGLDLSGHETIDAALQGHVRYFGDEKDIRGLVQKNLEPLAEVIIGEATQRWDGGARLDIVLVSGGGAKLIGKKITQHFPHARIVDDPVFANAIGFYRFGKRLWT